MAGRESDMGQWVRGRVAMATYADVGDEGIEEGEREPSLAEPACKC